MEPTTTPISYEQQAGMVDRLARTNTAALSEAVKRQDALARACLKIYRHKRPGVRFIAALIGPAARHLRAEVASIIHGRTIKPSHKEAGYLRLRESLLFAAGIGEDCTAGENAAFEREAARLVIEPETKASNQ